MACRIASPGRSGRSAAIALADVLVALAGLAGVVATSSPVSAGAPRAPEAVGATVPFGSSSQTLTVDGLARTYRVYRPTSAGTGRAVPLVVMLHGGFGSGLQAERAYGWDAQAARQHFVAAYPDGLYHAWNAGGGCCGKAAAMDVDDVKFISTVVATLRRELSIDPRRIYVTGISNGGIMAYRLACETSIFAAIGPDSATMLGSCRSPEPVSVIHIHGTADRRIPYDGGLGQGAGHIDGPAIPAVNATWRGIDHCAAPEVAIEGTVTTSVARCPDGRAVELITLEGAGHQRPGGIDRPVLQRLAGLDPPSKALNATSTIWAFFAAHPKAAG